MNTQNTEYPRVQKSDKSLRVDLRARTGELRAIEMGMAVDLDRYGDVIGIEAIAVRYYGGPNLFQNLDLAAMRWATEPKLVYSEDVDALYILLEKDRSLDQRPVNGKLLIEPSGQLAGIEIELT